MCLLFIGCSKSPIDRTTDASNGGPTGTFGVAPAFVIFSSELVSGGGAFEYPGPEGQSLVFNDQSNPISHRSIRYSWTGQPVSNNACQAQNPTHNFAGFDLMHVADDTVGLTVYKNTPGRDMSKAGYNKVTFYTRGSLSTNTYLKVEVAGPGSTDACAAVVSPCVVLFDPVRGDPRPGSPNPSQDNTCTTGTLSAGWQNFAIPLGSTLATTKVKDFFKATFIFVDPFVGNQNPGQGGAAYFDQIQYQP